jgi:hypothetical protein
MFDIDSTFLNAPLLRHLRYKWCLRRKYKKPEEQRDAALTPMTPTPTTQSLTLNLCHC